MGVLACGCREKTELQKSYAFSQKAGFVRMAEGMKQNVDKYYVPDYAKAYAFADSAIAHSPGNPHFYSMKAVWYMWDGEYRKAVNIYQRLFGRGVLACGADVRGGSGV